MYYVGSFISCVRVIYYESLSRSLGLCLSFGLSFVNFSIILFFYFLQSSNDQRNFAIILEQQQQQRRQKKIANFVCVRSIGPVASVIHLHAASSHI